MAMQILPMYWQHWILTSKRFLMSTLPIMISIMIWLRITDMSDD